VTFKIYINGILCHTVPNWVHFTFIFFELCSRLVKWTRLYYSHLSIVVLFVLDTVIRI